MGHCRVVWDLGEVEFLQPLSSGTWAERVHNTLSSPARSIHSWGQRHNACREAQLPARHVRHRFVDNTPRDLISVLKEVEC